MVRVSINNNTTKLSGDSEALRALYNHLRYKHPDAFFIQKKIKYKWDGFVEPLSKTGVMKTGLLESAIEFLHNEQGVEEFEVEDFRKPLVVGQVPTKLGEFTLRPYQVEAAKAVVDNQVLETQHQRGIILAAVNSGKTLIMFAIHKAIVGGKTIILLNNKVLFDQLKADLRTVFPDSYGYLQGSTVKWGDIMVVMVMSLNNRLDEYESKLREYNILLTDECDLAGNKTFEKAYRALQHIRLRSGFTGTAFLRHTREDIPRNTKMLEIFGSVLFTITMKELEELEVSTPITVKLIPGNQQRREDLSFKEEWDEQITYNTAHHELIRRRVDYNWKTKKRYIMVFCRYIAQVEETYNYLVAHSSLGYKIAYAHHSSNYATVLEAFKAGEIHVLVCSLFLKRGLNLPLVNTIINAAGGEYYSSPLQIAGRGTRKHHSKKVVYLEDIQDRGQYLARHSKQRIEYYRDQNLIIRDLR